MTQTSPITQGKLFGLAPTIALIAFAFLTGYVFFCDAHRAFAAGDPWGYYLHLPSIFIYQDVGDYSRTLDAWHEHYPQEADPRVDPYGLRETPIGKTSIKYPLGVAFLQSPFFLATHYYGLWSGAYAADGFSDPYTMVASWLSMLYVLAGLALLWFSLKRSFPSVVVRSLTLVTIGLGTNLFYFVTVNPGMAHTYLFFLFSLMLFATERWVERSNWRNAVFVGLSAGLIALTRLPDAIAVFIPFFWGLENPLKLPVHLKKLWDKRGAFVWAIPAFLVVLLPQSLYYLEVAGKWWYYSYQGESFQFDDPHVFKGMFSFQNGWLIYTPVMSLALVGIAFLRRYAPFAFWPIVFFLPIHLYITYSWWCWNYINGFGSRPMIDIYPVLAFPLAAFIQSMWGKSGLRWILLTAMAFFIWLNLFQTWQWQNGLLWTEDANWAFYRAMFAQPRSNSNALVGYESRESQPKSDRLAMEQVLAVDSMEDSTAVEYSSLYRAGGQYSFHCTGEYGPVINLPLGSLAGGYQSDRYFKVSVKGFLPPESPSPKREKAAMLVIDFKNAEGKSLKWRCVKISTKIGNPDFSIWSGGVRGVWGEAALFVTPPKGLDHSGTINVYVWNPSRQDICIDDLKLEQYRRL